MSAVSTPPGGPFPSRSTVIYTGRLVDSNGAGIPADELDSLTLSLAVTNTGAIVNGVEKVDILNTGRGVVDDEGYLTITLTRDDTDIGAAPANTQRTLSMVLDWTFNGGAHEGRHEVRLRFIALTES